MLGVVYKLMAEKMRLLWSGDLLMNTVHVHDLVRGLWHLAHHGRVVWAMEGILLMFCVG